MHIAGKRTQRQTHERISKCVLDYVDSWFFLPFLVGIWCLFWCIKRQWWLFWELVGHAC